MKCKCTGCKYLVDNTAEREHIVQGVTFEKKEVAEYSCKCKDTDKKTVMTFTDNTFKVECTSYNA